MDKNKIYIIGAGISGLSAAYYLNKAGFTDIEIFESSPYAGGRCRSYFDDVLGCEVDNGNHLILRANENVFGLIDELGTRERFNEFTSPIFNFYNHTTGEKYNFKPPFPNLKRYGIREIAEFYKFLFLPARNTVSESFKNAPKFFEEVINPISRSILNTNSEDASAAILRNVFLKIMKAGRAGFNYYYPKKGWGNALIEPLVENLQKNGVKINFSTSVKRLEFAGDKVTRIVLNEKEINIDNEMVILAVPASAAGRLADITTPEKFETIYNINFKFPHNLSLQIHGVINAPVEWFFVKDGIISTTFSAASNLENLSDDEIVKTTWEIFRKIFNIKHELPEHRIIKEKRATFACEKNELAKRPSAKTQWNNLFLCGDYIENGLPATIEGAAMNGKSLSKTIYPGD